VRASFAGSDNYLGDHADATVTVAKAATTTTVTCPVSVSYDGSAKTPCAASVIGAGGLSLSPTPSYSNNTNAGTAVAAYTYAGDSNHNSSSDSKTFTISKATPTVNVTWSGWIVDGTAHPATGSVIGVGTPAPDLGAPTFTYYSGSSATGTPLGGAPLGVGQYTVLASFAGSANYAATSKTVTIWVTYASSGACNGDAGHTILQPVNADGSSVFKQGSTVPAKFRVCNANGASIATPGVVASFKLTQTIIGTVVSNVDETVDSTTPDTAFRWDSTAQQWIYNINTKSLSANRTYVYTITLNDNSTIQFRFGLK
jgi:hypothetical protein